MQPARLNDQLSELMPGLSAKVFRTYNASVTLEAELEEMPVDTKEAEKVRASEQAHGRLCERRAEKAWRMITAFQARS